MHQIRLIRESDMPRELDAAIVELLCLANVPERDEFRRDGRGWHGVKPIYCVCVEIEGRPVAYVGIVDRVVRVGAEELRVAGVQNVSVHPDSRGQGLSIKALELAMSEADKLGFDVGLLFCTEALQRLYGKMGWVGVGKRPVVRVEGGRELPLPEQNVAMFLPLRVKTFPDGPIHLQGNDW